MANETNTEYLAYAKTALANKEPEKALEWLDKHLEQEPDDIGSYVLAGNVCITLRRYGTAYDYIKKAYDKQPFNGDLAFSLANTFMFGDDIGRAFELYAEAEMKGVSAETEPTLHYQLAMICSYRGDYKGAMINFRKFEETDTSGDAQMSPEIISQKLQLALKLGDLDEASRCAVRLISISPQDFAAYAAYFGLLRAAHEFDRAEQVLADAERYADLTEDDRLTVSLQRVELLEDRAAAESDTEKAGELLWLAYNGLTELLDKAPADRQNEIGVKLSELCMKRGEYAEAIAIASVMMPSDTIPEDIGLPAYEEPEPLTDEQQEMLGTEYLQKITELIDSGEIDTSAEEGIEEYYDGDGELVRKYSDAFIEKASQAFDIQKPEPVPEFSPSKQPDARQLDKLYYVLAFCSSKISDHRSAAKYGELLKHSSKEALSDYGRYIEAVSKKRLAGSAEGFTEAEAAETCDEAASYFKSRMIRGGAAPTAIMYRGMLYAENGKYAKAEQMAGLLVSEKRNELLRYIDERRGSQKID